MAVPVTLRCPRCGNFLRAVAPFPTATALTRCPHCLAILPFVAPRDPAPLFSWEVHPGLYAMGSLPRPPGRWLRPTTVAFLAAGVVLLLVLGGWLSWMGSEALAPGTVQIGGTVVATPGSFAPIAGANVTVHGENNFIRIVRTSSVGQFQVPQIPDGGVELEASATGYSPVHISLFVSPVYTSVRGDLANLEIGLMAGNATNVTSVSTTAFPNLESLVASLWSGTGLLSIATAVAAFGTAAAWKRRTPMAVAGGAGILFAPAVLPFLALDGVAPVATVLSFFLLPIGAVVLALAVPALIRGAAPVEPI